MNCRNLVRKIRSRSLGNPRTVGGGNMTYANLVKETRLQSYARHVDVPVVVNRLEAPCGAGGGPPEREGPQGRPLPPPLPFPAYVGFDTCARSPNIKELYILQLHLDHIGIPPEDCAIFTAKRQVEALKELYKKFNIEADITGIQAEEIGHLYFKANPFGSRYSYAESYAVVLHEHHIVLIDECDNPKSVFERFRKLYSDYTIAIMRVPYSHSAVSYLNNPWQVRPHWLADNKAKEPYAPNVLPKVLPSLLDVANPSDKI